MTFLTKIYGFFKKILELKWWENISESKGDVKNYVHNQIKHFVNPTKFNLLTQSASLYIGVQQWFRSKLHVPVEQYNDNMTVLTNWYLRNVTYKISNSSCFKCARRLETSFSWYKNEKKVKRIFCLGVFIMTIWFMSLWRSSLYDVDMNTSSL